jgi:hypothetical protein
MEEAKTSIKAATAGAAAKAKQDKSKQPLAAVQRHKEQQKKKQGGAARRLRWPSLQCIVFLFAALLLHWMSTGVSTFDEKEHRWSPSAGVSDDAGADFWEESAGELSPLATRGIVGSCVGQGCADTVDLPGEGSGRIQPHARRGDLAELGLIKCHAGTDGDGHRGGGAPGGSRHS